MRTIHTIFTDKEFKEVKAMKIQGESWHNFMLRLVREVRK